MGEFNSDFVKRTSEALSNKPARPKLEMWGDLLSEEEGVESDEPPMPGKVVALSGKYDDQYMPEDDLSGLRDLMKVPIIQMLVMALFGGIVVILLIVILS